LINFLINYKINHYDIKIRESSSYLFGCLTVKSKDYILKILGELLEKLYDKNSQIEFKHGIILVISNILLFLTKNDIKEDLVDKIINIIPFFKNDNIYKLEFVKNSFSMLIKSISLINFDLNVYDNNQNELNFKKKKKLTLL
jgi:hypothetical protein